MPRTGGRFLFQACLNSVIPFTLIAWAERSIDAGLATILNSTSPIFTFLLTLAITRHEPVTARKLFGVLAGLAGICLIVGVQALSGLGEQLVAQIAIMAATVCYAGAAIFSRGFKDLDPMAPAAGSLLCGAAILVPLSLVVDRPWTLAPSASSMLALLGLAVFSTALAFVIYFRLIQTLGSVGTTAQAYLRVPIGVAIGVVFLGETLTSTRLDRPRLCRDRRRRDDDSRAHRQSPAAALLTGVIIGILPRKSGHLNAPERSGQGTHHEDRLAQLRRGGNGGWRFLACPASGKRRTTSPTARSASSFPIRRAAWSTCSAASSRRTWRRSGTARSSSNPNPAPTARSPPRKSRARRPTATHGCW